jgi:hypothetical protein
MGWATFWAIRSQTHPVTLIGRHRALPSVGKENFFFRYRLNAPFARLQKVDDQWAPICFVLFC